MDVDNSYNNFKIIKSEFDTFLSENKYVTEADTRINLIDRILYEVLGWPKNFIQREPHSEAGYLDYSFKINGRKQICIEAKREGVTFNFPNEKSKKYYKISGALSTSDEIFAAIKQARAYCDELAIRYAIVTNGNSWIVFRAIREDIPWKEGNARIFKSIEYIGENFTEFWNLLSYSCLIQGSLEEEFSVSTTARNEAYRVISSMPSPDTPLLRNSLHSELHPVITAFFEDIADPEYIEKLVNCYVYSQTIKTVGNDINFVIEDSLPRFLKEDGAIDVVTGKHHAGNFGRVIEKVVKGNKGQLFLLLGGIGSGKTTFQKRYQLTVGKTTLNEFSIWFSIDFLKPPLDPAQLENFVWDSLLTQLREKYTSPHLETRNNIKRIFRSKINALMETNLHNLTEGSPEFEKILSPYLAKWQENLSEYVSGLLSLAKPKKNLNVVLFFDNVDQLTTDYQSQIFILAQRISDIISSITIIALREESYYTATIQKVFTAYINRKFHIASPPFRKMIAKRIAYALKIIDDRKPEAVKYQHFKELPNKNNISDFLKIVEYSIFEKNKNIARFIDHICFGNMRQALQMFSTFLVSGATDVDKMLRIYHRDGNYFVAFHEFIRSIMLGEHYYYKESHSPIMNLFDCGQSKNSSHFTAIRILSILNLHRLENSKEGQGFYEFIELQSVFDDTFNNTEDFIKTLNRLVGRQLVETNTKNTNINGATHLKISSAGWYYLKYLMVSFAYLDLVFQDTPITNKTTVTYLETSMKKVNNLSDHDDDKIYRMEERFKRVEVFLNYLDDEEKNEENKFFFNGKSSAIYSLFMPGIKENFNAQKDWILKRIKENREKYDEEYTMTEAEFYDLINVIDENYEMDSDE